MHKAAVVLSHPFHLLRHVEAAEAWLALGAHVAASDELDEITPGLRALPEVLLVRAKICYAAHYLHEAIVLAEAVVGLHPNMESAWLQLAFYQEKEAVMGWQTALLTLNEALGHFPFSSEVWFQMSRMLMALGMAESAEIAFKASLRLAEEAGPQAAQRLKLRALEDRHIALLLWPED